MSTVPRLYRAILKETKRFPSTKRDAIAEDIKNEFHTNKLLTDRTEIKKQLNLAKESLEQLQSYNQLTGTDAQLYLKGPACGT